MSDQQSIKLIPYNAHHTDESGADAAEGQQHPPLREPILATFP